MPLELIVAVALIVRSAKSVRVSTCRTRSVLGLRLEGRTIFIARLFRDSTGRKTLTGGSANITLKELSGNPETLNLG